MDYYPPISYDEIKRRIARKHPYDLCKHEIRWLIAYELFGEKDDKGVYGSSTLAIRLYRWYKQHNPAMLGNIPIEQFVEEFYERKLKASSFGSYGFVKVLTSLKNRQTLRKILVESGEVITKRPSSFTLWTYSHGQLLKKLKNLEQNKLCGDLDCVICGGVGHRERIKAMTAFAGMMIDAYGSEFIKLAKRFFEKKMEEFNGDYEELTRWIYSQRTSSVVDSPEVYQDIIDELREEVEQE